MEPKPHPIDDLVVSLTQALELENPPKPGDPGFEAYVDDQTLLQQVELAQHFQMAVSCNSENNFAAANLLRALGLVERTRARFAKIKRAKETAASKIESRQPPQPDRDEAKHFLQTELSGGERAAKDLITLARSIGIAHSTLKRAKAALGIASIQRALPNDTNCWMWSMPAFPASAPTT